MVVPLGVSLGSMGLASVCLPPGEARLRRRLAARGHATGDPRVAPTNPADASGRALRMAAV